MNVEYSYCNKTKESAGDKVQQRSKTHATSFLAVIFHHTISELKHLNWEQNYTKLELMEGLSTSKKALNVAGIIKLRSK